MSVLVNQSTRVLVQGITGKEGSAHARRSIEYGTKIVAGVTPGRGGQSFEGVPVFNTVSEAVKETNPDCSLIFVPAPFAADAILEAANAGLPLVICVTEGVPTLDMVVVKRALRGSGTRLIGPNCPGVITPGECRVGIMPADVFSSGAVGVVSRTDRSPSPPGRCRLCVTSKMTGQPNDLIRASERKSTTRSLYPNVVPRSVSSTFLPPALRTFSTDSAAPSGARN